MSEEEAEYKYSLPDHPVTYEKVQTEDLKVDNKVQRSLNPTRAQGIADHMIPSAIGPFTVSRRKNVQHKGRVTSPHEDYIVDGYHRWWACGIVGIEEVWAEVHHDLTLKDEAVLFLIKNRESYKPTPFDEYNIGLEGKVAIFVETQKVLDAHALRMGKSSSPGVEGQSPGIVGSVQGVVRITEKYGPNILDRALYVAIRAFGRDSDTWNGYALTGIAQFLDKHPGLRNVDAELPNKLQKFRNARTSSNFMASIHARATGSGGTGGRAAAAYQLTVLAWNQNRTKKIVQDW
jgi:hypothetical protein